MPSEEPSADVSRLLGAVQDGQRGAEDRLFEAVHAELRRIAHAKMRGEPAGQTLQTTALVHEAYLRLVADGNRDWKNRGYFFGAAAEAMRRILVDRARRRQATKRGGDLERVPLQDDAVASESDPDLLALDEALRGLEEQDARKGSVVKLRYFVGLSVEETATLLGVAPRTVDQDWRLAKAWLRREIGGR